MSSRHSIPSNSHLIFLQQPQDVNGDDNPPLVRRGGTGRGGGGEIGVGNATARTLGVGYSRGIRTGGVCARMVVVVVIVVYLAFAAVVAVRTAAGLKNSRGSLPLLLPPPLSPPP